MEDYMKKICILSAVNLKHMSLISAYTKIFKLRGIDFDIIYMDKYDVEEKIECKNIYRYINKINPSSLRIKKLFQYLSFVPYAIRIINKNKYDFIIVWNDVAIIMFSIYLALFQKKKYCLNIRDYAHQEYRLIYYLFKLVVENSVFTTISSNGFKTFLPKFNYIMLHSLNENVLNKCIVREKLAPLNRKIRITFIGNVRFFEINKRLLDIFANDERFELHYYGTNSEVLEQYAAENNINNAIFGGAFSVNDTYKFIDRTDIINNLYGSGNPSVDYALSIKLYYGIFCNIPILVEKNTYMETISKELSMGYVVDSLSDDLNDRVYEWYRKINFDKLRESCNNYLVTIKKENALFDKEVNKNV